MTLSTVSQAYQEFVGKSVFEGKSFDEQETIFALGVAGEAGEVAELKKKQLDRGKLINPQELVLELGDVLWYITALARLHGFTLEYVMTANKAKLEARRRAKEAEAAKTFGQSAG